jgi:hypothetical protein
VRRLRIGHLDAREVRDTANGAEIDGHPKASEYAANAARPYTSSLFSWQTAVRDQDSRRPRIRP